MSYISDLIIASVISEVSNLSDILYFLNIKFNWIVGALPYSSVLSVQMDFYKVRDESKVKTQTVRWHVSKLSKLDMTGMPHCPQTWAFKSNYANFSNVPTFWYQSPCLSIETSSQNMQGQGHKGEMWKSQALGETDIFTTAHTTKMALDKLLV